MTQKISYDRNTPVGSEIAIFVNKVMDVLADGRRLKGQLDAITYGSDFSALAKEVNLPDPAVISDTSAQDAWTIVSIAMAQIDSPQTASLSRLDQG